MGFGGIRLLIAGAVELSFAVPIPIRRRSTPFIQPFQSPTCVALLLCPFPFVPSPLFASASIIRPIHTPRPWALVIIPPLFLVPLLFHLRKVKARLPGFGALFGHLAAASRGYRSQTLQQFGGNESENVPFGPFSSAFVLANGRKWVAVHSTGSRGSGEGHTLEAGERSQKHLVLEERLADGLGRWDLGPVWLCICASPGDNRIVGPSVRCPPNVVPHCPPPHQGTSIDRVFSVFSLPTIPSSALTFYLFATMSIRSNPLLFPSLSRKQFPPIKVCVLARPRSAHGICCLPPIEF